MEIVLVSNALEFQNQLRIRNEHLHHRTEAPALDGVQLGQVVEAVTKNARTFGIARQQPDFFLLAIDAAGVPHEEEKALTRLNAVSNSPIFSFSDSFFGHGIVGGPLISVQDYSRQTANIAVRLLRGEAPSDLRMPPVGLSTPKFDWREMQRWGIPESRLPLGSEIHFRDPTAWEQYRLQIIAICAALLAQAALVGWLIYEIGRRHRAEIQSRSAIAALTYMDRRASAEQRSATLAHEINQPLAGIATRASAALRWLRMEKPDIEKAQTALESIVAASHRASD